MIICIPKEIKDNENRVAATPESVKAFCSLKHRVIIEASAGMGSGVSDEEYADAGGQIVQSKSDLYADANMILKVRELLPPEYNLIKEGQIIFSFLLPERNLELTRVLVDKRVVAIAYEKVMLDDGSRPILASMSRIAGKLSVFAGAHYLQQTQGGRGILLADIPGVKPPFVMILGGGIVGTNAATTAAALGAQVVILEINEDRLSYLKDTLPANVSAVISTPEAIRKNLREADLLINATIWPVDANTYLVTRDMIKLMKRGSVIVDVSAEKKGAIETYVQKTHADPTYEVDGVIHYCVQNMPGAVPKTATPALISAALPYALEIANKGWRQALKENLSLLRGLCFANGCVTHEGTAKVHGLKYYSSEVFV